MNRIEKYFPDDRPSHGYECDCDGCQNCEPQQTERLVVVLPLADLIQRDQAMYRAGRQEADQLAAAVITGLQRTSQARIEAAYREGKGTAHAMWLLVMAIVAGCTVIIEALR